MENLIKKAKSLSVFEFVMAGLFAFGCAIAGVLTVLSLLGGSGDVGDAFGTFFAAVFGIIIGLPLLGAFIVTLISAIIGNKACKSEDNFKKTHKSFLAFSIIYFVIVALLIVPLVVSCIKSFSVVTFCGLVFAIMYFAVLASIKLSISRKIKSINAQNNANEQASVDSESNKTTI